MFKSKKMMGALCMMALAASMSAAASAADLNAAQTSDNNQTPVVMSESFNVDYDAVSTEATRQSGWKSYSYATPSGGGKWYGGVRNDGTLYSNACAYKYQSRVWVKAGKNATKRWSGWASANQHSVRSVQAAASGNTCGYDLNN